MKNVLFITQGIYPLNSGSALASRGYCTEFSRNCKLTVFSLLPNEIDINVATKICKTNRLNIVFCHTRSANVWLDHMSFLFTNIRSKYEFTRPLYRTLFNAVEKYIAKEKVDIIIIDHIVMFEYFDRLKKKYPNIKYIYNSHNVEYLNCEEEYLNKGQFKKDFIGKIKKAITKRRCLRRKKCEQILLKNAQCTFCISKNDMRLLKNEFGEDINVIHNKPFIKFYRVKTKEDLKVFSKKIMIVASMNWYPNVEGIVWFIEKVFAELIKIQSDYLLYLVGKNPHEKLIQMQKKYPNNIIITGFVESTDSYFKRCDISVIPVFVGTGAKIKVLESIGRGIPTIASAFAAKDYDISDEIIVAEKPQEFLQGILKIENNQEYRQYLYNRMKQYCEHYYTLSPEVKNELS